VGHARGTAVQPHFTELVQRRGRRGVDVVIEERHLDDGAFWIGSGKHARGVGSIELVERNEVDGRHLRVVVNERRSAWTPNDNRCDEVPGPSGVIIQGAEYREREPAASGMFAAHIGKGDIDPLLSMPELSEPEDEA